MAKVRYKKISKEMERIMHSPHQSGRFSTGMEEKVGEYYYLEIGKLKPYRKQARKNFDSKELTELAETIKEHGIRQPLSVIQSPDMEGIYEVISGERRLRAAKIVGLQKIPCIILKDLSRAEEVALIENIQRSDLHPVELSDAYRQILEKKGHGGVKDLASALGKPPSSVSETAKLSSLPEEIKKFLIAKNMRSKIVFRKILRMQTIEEMKAYLGIDGLKHITPKNVMRVSLLDGEFNVEAGATDFLSEGERKGLKVVLEEFLKTL